MAPASGVCADYRSGLLVVRADEYTDDDVYTMMDSQVVLGVAFSGTYRWTA